MKWKLTLDNTTDHEQNQDTTQGDTTIDMIEADADIIKIMATQTQYSQLYKLSTTLFLSLKGPFSRDTLYKVAVKQH